MQRQAAEERAMASQLKRQAAQCVQLEKHLAHLKQEVAHYQQQLADLQHAQSDMEQELLQSVTSQLADARRELFDIQAACTLAQEQAKGQAPAGGSRPRQRRGAEGGDSGGRHQRDQGALKAALVGGMEAAELVDLAGRAAADVHDTLMRLQQRAGATPDPLVAALLGHVELLQRLCARLRVCVRPAALLQRQAHEGGTCTAS